MTGYGLSHPAHIWVDEMKTNLRSVALCWKEKKILHLGKKLYLLTSLQLQQLMLEKTLNLFKLSQAKDILASMLPLILLMMLVFPHHPW